MTTMSPTEMAQRLGGGLLSFPVTHFDADGAFVEDGYRKHCAWMLEHEYESVEQLKGSMSQQNCANPSAFERAQYMQAISTRPLS